MDSSKRRMHVNACTWIIYTVERRKGGIELMTGVGKMK